MSHCDPQPSGEPADRAVAIAAALAELGVRPEERVLIMLPDGPGFIDAFTGAMKRGAVPLAVDPRRPAADVAAIATKTGAQLVLASPEQIHELADLEAEPLALVDGLQGLWTAALRQH
jgi:acyl-CoA synthetase (AMP-forming)/AMP-acid ligase II